MSDGVTYLRSPETLGPYPVKLTEKVDYWGTHVPARVFLASREESGLWRTITYGEFRESARNVAQALLNRRLSPSRPIAILSGNDIEHALLGVGAMYAGIPYAPICPAYSLLSTDLARLGQVLKLLHPQLVFAANSEQFRRAIEGCVKQETELVFTEGRLDGWQCSLFSTLRSTSATTAVDQSVGKVHAGTNAKVLFTSGSAGMPKGVVNTHLMLTSNQEMLRSVVPSLTQGPPVLCDWLPWHHTFGGNHNFGLVLYNGGTLYIDSGRPTPDGIEQTKRNLREIAPTIYFNVPKGFAALAGALREDSGLRNCFFSRIGELFCAAATLPRDTREELKKLASKTCWRPVRLMTGFGSTETGPLALIAGGEITRADAIGVPVPGLEVKLVPRDGKLELRVRGPNVMTDYWGDEQLTRTAFDAEGFYGTGDAVTFDSNPPVPTLFFDGRITEDFKLSTGTWVSTGPLRLRLLRHCGSIVRDVVLAGQDRSEVTALIFINQEHNGERALSFCIEQSLRSFASQSTGSSNRIARATILTEPPSFDAGEITDKGSINRQAALIHRARLVEDLYAVPSPQHVFSCLDSGDNRSLNRLKVD